MAEMRWDGVWIHVEPGFRSSSRITVVGVADADSVTRMMSYTELLDEVERFTDRHPLAPVHVDARGNGPAIVDALRQRGVAAFERGR
jgi:hypothetical protein